MSHDHSHSHAAEKGRVALFSLLASGALAIAKFAAALVSGSLGLLSEAFHSLLDFGATAMTLFAVRVADKPADDTHHYGHAKIESLVALVETGLLLLVTGYVTYESIKRLLYGGHDVEVSWWLFAIVIASIVIDFNRSRALQATADKTSSDALAADALHFSADMYSSIAVLIGLIFTWLGYTFADSLAALVVAGFVGYAAFGLGRQTINNLLDAAPVGAAEKIQREVEAANGVLRVSQLRVRPVGPTMFIDASIDVPRTLPNTQVEAVRADVERRVRSVFPESDISLQVAGVALDSESAHEKVAFVAAQHGLAVHHLAVQDINGRLAVSFDLEVDGGMSLNEAHERATQLETAVREGLGTDVEVESHIEPMAAPLLNGAVVTGAAATRITSKLTQLCKKEKALTDLHNIRIRQNSSGMFVHYHCRFQGDATVEDVHAIIDRIEVALTDAMPTIRRVVAHAEPVGVGAHAL